VVWIHLAETWNTLPCCNVLWIFSDLHIAQRIYTRFCNYLYFISKACVADCLTWYNLWISYSAWWRFFIQFILITLDMTAGQLRFKGYISCLVFTFDWLCILWSRTELYIPNHKLINNTSLLLLYIIWNYSSIKCSFHLTVTCITSDPRNYYKAKSNFMKSLKYGKRL
jgi:hypothetical protein